MDDLVRAAREAEAVAYERPPDAPEVPRLEQCGDWADGYERGAMAAARAIRALPRSEWRDRMPTPEEIRAHAEAHGDGHGYGLWMHIGTDLVRRMAHGEVRPAVVVHTANPVAAPRMVAALADAGFRVAPMPASRWTGYDWRVVLRAVGVV